MPNYDPHANLVYSTVAVAPSPAGSGTTLSVQTADAANWPDPASGAYNALVWPSGAGPTLSNGEIVRVTAKSGSQLTITRAQEGTSARAIGVDDQIAIVFSKKSFTDIETVADAAIPKGTVTTNGDLMYGNGASSVTRLAIGSTDQVLTVAGGIPAWVGGSKATLTTTGDLLYASGANALARLAIGSTNQCLRVVGGIPAWFTNGYFNRFDIVNTLAESNIISQSIPGGTLGSNNAVLIVIEGDYFNNSAATRTLTIAVKYGATTLWSATTAALAASATRAPFYFTALLAGDNATNAQRLAGGANIGAQAAATNGIGTWGGTLLASVIFGGSSAEDSTAAKTLAVTATHSTNNASLELRGTAAIHILS
jgi:hypothetical protein